MPIGKIAFWVTAGDTTPYRGKYARASAAMPSRLADESPCLDGAW
jgi:hypothetical protein